MIFPKINTKKIGNLGENIAARYLIKNKYHILKRNYKEGFDEIDLIAKNNVGDLIFFEVKTMTNYNNSNNVDLNWFMPEDHLTGQKLKRIVRVCRKFAVSNEQLINNDRGWQIDLIAITVKNWGRYDLRHYKNI